MNRSRDGTSKPVRVTGSMSCRATIPFATKIFFFLCEQKSVRQAQNQSPILFQNGGITPRLSILNNLGVAVGRDDECCWRVAGVVLGGDEHDRAGGHRDLIGAMERANEAMSRSSRSAGARLGRARGVVGQPRQM
jgi:hypothetical protein